MQARQRIQLRNRSYETAIDPGYLALLNDLYADWVQRIDFAPVLTIETDDLDFVQREADWRFIRNRVQDRLPVAI